MTVPRVANGDRTQLIRVETRDGHVTFTGRRLGSGSSRRDSHWQHPPSSYAAPGERCSGCRWSEIKIFRDDDAGQYVVSMIGRSVVPGESDKIKTIWTKDPDDVVDALLVPPRGNRGGPLELPHTNADALGEAASSDDDLARAFTEFEDDRS